MFCIELFDRSYFLLGERFLRFVKASEASSGELWGDLLRLFFFSIPLEFDFPEIGDRPLLCVISCFVDVEARCPRELVCKCVPFLGGRPKRLAGALEPNDGLQK